MKKINFTDITEYKELEDIEKEIYKQANILGSLVTYVFLEIDYEINARLYISDGCLYGKLVKIPLKKLKDDPKILSHLLHKYDNAYEWLEHLIKK